MTNTTWTLINRKCCHWTAILSVFLFSLSANAVQTNSTSSIEYFPSTMTVITSNARPLRHEANIKNAFALRGKASHFHIFNLDAVRALEDDLSRNLPANEHLATQVVKHRLSNIGKPVLSQRISDAYAALTTAMRFGITHYPAVIFDNTYVVVGVSDLHVALRAYQAHKSGGE